MDHLPVDPGAPEPPLPRRQTLALLVGRVTTIKLVYWTALTLIEGLLPFAAPGPFAERFPYSIAAASAVSVAVLVWARYAARGIDRSAGALSRSIPTVATTFAAATVVASPASLPLLLVERQRSLEACGVVTCHGEALLLWVAVLAVGTVLIPGVFAASLRAS